MAETFIKIRDLDKAKVFFHPVDGPTVQAFVTHVWPQMGTVPGVNIETVDGIVESSVPHKSAVPEASSFFWTFGPNSSNELAP